MSKIRLIISLFMFVPIVLVAQVKYFEIKPIAPPTQFSLNVDHPDCGQIVVYSTLPRLVFESNMAGIQETKYSALESKYVIFLRPVRQKIVVKSPGFIEAELWGPGVPRAKAVVEYFTIEERKPEVDQRDINSLSVYPVTFKITPSDAELLVNNKAADATKPIMLKAGTNILELNKPGYKTEKRLITVGADQLFFEINLARQDLVLVTINTNPEGAGIVIDNVAEGRSNRQFYRFPGTYRLRIAQTGYETIEEQITVAESGNNVFSYKLNKTTATLRVNPVPPDARIVINNTIYDSKEIELAPGFYKLEVQKSGFNSYESVIEVKDNNTIVRDVTLVQQTGRLVFTVQPTQAHITLNNGQSWIGANLLPMAVGEYRLRADASGYQTFERIVKIENNRDTIVDCVLNRLSPKMSESEEAENTLADMVLVEKGNFRAGSANVSLSAYYIGIHEVSKREWMLVMFSNPSSDQHLDKPVERVSWFDTIEYCNRRSINEGIEPVYEYENFGTNPDDWPNGWNLKNSNQKYVKYNDKASGYRLPTEMEWQYAAIGGSKSKGYTYSGSDDINIVAWYKNNSNNRTQEVGKLRPNELGIYDMSGNVWEWCWDLYGDLPRGYLTNPKGISKGTQRVRRGGSADQASRYCTNTYRYANAPTDKIPTLGFRVARNAQ